MAKNGWRKLHYLPLPERGVLAPDAAREWLAESAPEWVTVLSHGLNIEDKSIRDDYAMLACDVRTMLETAVETIGGSAAHFGRDEQPGALAAIARIVASMWEAFEGSMGPFESCYQALAADLAKRLATASETA